MTDRDAAAVEKAVEAIVLEDAGWKTTEEHVRDTIIELRREWLTVPCPTCEGDEFIVDPVDDAMDECPDCKGTGRVPIQYAAAMEVAEHVAGINNRGGLPNGSDVLRYARRRWLEGKE